MFSQFPGTSGLIIIFVVVFIAPGFLLFGLGLVGFLSALFQFDSAQLLILSAKRSPLRCILRS